MKATLSVETNTGPAFDEVRATRLLGDLVRICREGEELFRSAAERCGCDGLRGHLMERAQQRAGFHAALGTLQRRHGATGAQALESLTGWVEGWETFVPSSDDALLQEAEKHEAEASRRYRLVLEEYPGCFAADVSVLAFHLRQIGRSQEFLRNLHATVAG